MCQHTLLLYTEVLWGWRRGLADALTSRQTLYAHRTDDEPTIPISGITRLVPHHSWLSSIAWTQQLASVATTTLLLSHWPLSTPNVTPDVIWVCRRLEPLCHLALCIESSEPLAECMYLILVFCLLTGVLTVLLLLYFYIAPPTPTTLTNTDTHTYIIY